MLKKKMETSSFITIAFMKVILPFAIASCFIASLFAELEPPTISEYGGRYQGTMSLEIYAGTATAVFKTSKRKNDGTLTMNSILSIGTQTLPLFHQLTIRGRRLQYVLSSQFLTIPGTGMVKVKSRVITYHAVVNLSGSTANVEGTIRRTKRGLAITDVTTAGATRQTLRYFLKAKGKRHAPGGVDR